MVSPTANRNNMSGTVEGLSWPLENIFSKPFILLTYIGSQFSQCHWGYQIDNDRSIDAASKRRFGQRGW